MHFTMTESVAPVAIPTSLHASLLARLDRLAPVREVAQIAAALVRFWFKAPNTNSEIAQMASRARARGRGGPIQQSATSSRPYFEH